MATPTAEDLAKAREIVGSFTLELGPRYKLPTSALDGLRANVAQRLADQREALIEIVQATIPADGEYSFRDDCVAAIRGGKDGE